MNSCYKEHKEISPCSKYIEEGKVFISVTDCTLHKSVFRTASELGY